MKSFFLTVNWNRLIDARCDGGVRLLAGPTPLLSGSPVVAMREAGDGPSAASAGDADADGNTLDLSRRRKCGSAFVFFLGDRKGV